MKAITLLAALGLAVQPIKAEESAAIERFNRLIAESQFDAALELLPRITDLHSDDTSGATPLTAAAKGASTGHYDVVHALLRMGAGRTPSHYAALAETLSVVHLLVDGWGADPSAPRLAKERGSDEEDIPIVRAATFGRGRAAELLKSRGVRLPERRALNVRYKLATHEGVRNCRT